MNLSNLVLLIGFAAVVGCSTPASPKPPQASGVASKSNGEATTNTGTPTAPQGAPSVPGGQISSVQTNSTDSYLGAKVGPDDLRKLINDCNVGGSYYNRSAHNCDTVTKLAAFPCKEDAIRQSGGIRPNELPTFNSIVQTEINNADPSLRYLFDQCVIPNTPDPDTGKTYRLKIYLAKETKVGDSIRIDTKVLRFEQ